MGNPKSAAKNRPVSNLNTFNFNEKYRTSSCDKFEEIKQKYIIRHFKVEGLFLLKEVLEKGFMQSVASRISAICKILMDGSVVPVPLSMLWSGTSNKNIYKTV